VKTDGGITGKVTDFFDTDLSNGSATSEKGLPPNAMNSMAACRCKKRR
jgi:hypothetical protein